MLAPATGFYGTPGLGKNEVRLAYVLNRESIAAAMDCLEKALEQYPGKIERETEPAYRQAGESERKNISQGNTALRTVLHTFFWRLAKKEPLCFLTKGLLF